MCSCFLQKTFGVAPAMNYSTTFITTAPLAFPQHRHGAACKAMQTPPASMAQQPPKPPVPIPLHLQSLRVLGLGMAGMDLVARVPVFPQPDSKIRTTSLTALGGGNTSNALTALRRLGVPVSLVSKVGGDVYGSAVLSELNADGIDTSNVIVNPDIQTAFTYVIVDEQSASRTCINTPSQEDLRPEDIHMSLLDGVNLVALDGRHPLAAVRLAQLAQMQKIPVLLDVERDRPHIGRLLQLADYIVTNSTYPFSFAPSAEGRVDALQRLLDECRASFVIGTQGSAGCTLIRRAHPRQSGTGFELVIRRGQFECRKSRHQYETLQCPRWPVDDVVDTTGAGDAFIGGVAYGLVTRMDLERMLSLASRVAASKLTGIGSRTGLPRREELPDTLLASLPPLLD